MKNKKITIKNYIIVVIIALITIGLTISLSAYYKNKKNYENELNTIMNFLSEIKVDELDNFIIENRDVMIYTANSELHNDKLQEKVKKFIKKNNYTKEIVYLNMKELNAEFYDSFAIKYFGELENTNIISDSLIIIKSGKVVSIININEENISNLKKNIESIYGE